VQAINTADTPPPTTLAEILPALLWLALALLAALLLRNSLPMVRTSARGMLVAFVNDWLPVPWENIRAIKVTEAGDRYVLLVETDRGWLTGWHRWYSFIYRLGFRPAFLITSQISEFDDLVKTLLSEADRAARTMATGRQIELQEGASSPLFRLLLSPLSFFAQRPSQRDDAPPAASPLWRCRSWRVSTTHPHHPGGNGGVHCCSCRSAVSDTDHDLSGDDISCIASIASLQST
jgi:hypothetical protein